MGAEDAAAKAVAALTRQVAGLEKAANESGSAAAHAGRAVGQAQQAGFSRVAEGLASLRGRIDKLAAMLSTAAGQITPGQQAAAEVTGQSTPAQAVNRLTATIGAIDSAHSTIASAVQETRDIETEASTILQGAQPGPLLAILGTVRETATQAAQQGTDAKQHAQTGIALGQQIAGGGTGN